MKLDYEVHFQMEVIDGETVYVCNICHEDFESSDVVDSLILCAHEDDLLEWEKQFEDDKDSSEDEDDSSEDEGDAE